MAPKIKTKKPKTKKSKKYQPAKVGANFAGQGKAFFSQSVNTIHKYGDVINQNSASPNLYNCIYKMNSMYDPDYSNSGTDHQPMGRDQMGILYNRYRVDSFKYKITVMPTTDNTTPFVGITMANGVASPATNIYQIIEQPFSNYRVLAYDQLARVPLTMSGHIQLHKVAGVTQEKYRTDDMYQSVYTASPSEDLSFIIQLGDLIAATSMNFQIAVELEYHTTWYDPLIQASS